MARIVQPSDGERPDSTPRSRTVQLNPPPAPALGERGHPSCPQPGTEPVRHPYRGRGGSRYAPSDLGYPPAPGDTPPPPISYPHDALLASRCSGRSRRSRSGSARRQWSLDPTPPTCVVGLCNYLGVSTSDRSRTSKRNRTRLSRRNRRFRGERRAATGTPGIERADQYNRSQAHSPTTETAQVRHQGPDLAEDVTAGSVQSYPLRPAQRRQP